MQEKWRPTHASLGWEVQPNVTYCDPRARAKPQMLRHKTVAVVASCDNL